MTTSDVLRQTPLFKENQKLNAKMTDFGGWQMPLQYEGILAEYHATRQVAALFDICHMGEFVIEGDCQAIGLDRIVTMNIRDMPIKSCRYGAMLNEGGGIIDDLIVFRIEEEKWFIVVNAATTQKDLEHLQKNLYNNFTFRDVSSETGKIDLQGPSSRKILSEMVDGIENLDYYTFNYFNLLGQKTLISRTGYTGELGYEIYCPWDKTPSIWRELLKNKNVKPAGLGARDILRLEMGYSLYGHELNEEITPLEAGLNRFVDLEKDFIGKEVLLKQKQSGLKRKLVGFVSQSRRAPRVGNRLYSSKEEEIGIVTSGSFSPSLNQGIGLGFVSSEFQDKGTKIFFGEKDRKVSAEISSKLFYSKGSLKD